MLACKRPLVTLDALRSVVRITLVSKRWLRFCDSRKVHAGIEITAEFKVISNDLGVLGLQR